MGFRVHQAGGPVLTPTAIEAWTSTVKALEVLWTGKSDQGLIFEVVLASVTISILVTGFETYAKTRLLELETEDIRANASGVFEAFASKAERESNRWKELEEEAATDRDTVLQKLIEAGKINFQSYDQVKRVYKRAYGIKLGEIGVSSQTLDELQRMIGYRHRVVHVSPLLGMLNEDKVPPDEPVFASLSLADRARECFARVVLALHEASLKLRRTDSTPFHGLVRRCNIRDSQPGASPEFFHGRSRMTTGVERASLPASQTWEARYIRRSRKRFSI